VEVSGLKNKTNGPMEKKKCNLQTSSYNNNNNYYYYYYYIPAPGEVYPPTSRITELPRNYVSFEKELIKCLDTSDAE
jgi:hypothetical protein